MYSKRYWHTLRISLMHNAFHRAEYIQKHQLFALMGDDVVFQLRKIPLHGELIKIHNNITVGANVEFVTHDVLFRIWNNREGEDRWREALFPIEILDNSFIGANSILCGPLRIGPNAIVGAGSVVTHDVPEGAIVAGCPARYIGSYEELMAKRADQPDRSFEEIWEDFYRERGETGSNADGPSAEAALTGEGPRAGAAAERPTQSGPAAQAGEAGPEERPSPKQ